MTTVILEGMLDDSLADDRKMLPHDKLPDGSFFILGDNNDMAFSNRISEKSIAKYQNAAFLTDFALAAEEQKI